MLTAINNMGRPVPHQRTRRRAIILAVLLSVEENRIYIFGRSRADYPKAPGHDHHAGKGNYGKQPAELLRRVRRIYRRPGRSKRIQGRAKRESKINGIL